MAGLLTFPQSALPSQPCERPVTFSKQTLCLTSHPITIIYGRKGTTFSSTTNHSAKIFQK